MTDSTDIPALPKQPKPKGGIRPGQGRKPGAVIAPATRERIRGAKILDRLQKHIMGEVEMTATQVRAGLGLLQFQLPLLAATELKATVNVTHENATPEQLRERMIEVGLDPDKVTTSLLQ